jgi:DNA polymerase-3 subunit beta
MKFSIKREDILKPLQTIVGVVERRQTLPVLSNILVVVHPEHHLNLQKMETSQSLHVNLLISAELYPITLT